MSEHTPIQWCDSTVNPVMGCAGCELAMPGRKDNCCYAWFSTIPKSQSGNPGWPRDFFEPKLFTGRMAKAARWRSLDRVARPEKPWLGRRPRLIFISDMGDALSETTCILPDGSRVHGVPFDYLESEIIQNVASPEGKRHVWLWLTKRPKRLRDFARQLGREWPENLWVGTSVTDETTLPRVAALEEVGNSTTTRFVSAEPLWAGVRLEPYLKRGRIGWVIAGGESKQQKRPTRPFDLGWARRLRDECKAAGVSFFLKQLGHSVVEDGHPIPAPHGSESNHQGDWRLWPVDLRVRELPRLERAGRGRMHETKSRSVQPRPQRISSLDLPAIAHVIRELEASDDHKSVRERLAEELGVSPNTIDWCRAHRTMARKAGSDWPFS